MGQHNFHWGTIKKEASLHTFFNLSSYINLKQSGGPPGTPAHQPCLLQRGDFASTAPRSPDSKVKQLVHINHHKDGTKSIILLELQQIKLQVAIQNQAAKDHTSKEDERTPL